MLPKAMKRNLAIERNRAQVREAAAGEGAEAGSNHHDQGKGLKMVKLGITDEVTTCECCGKSNLKRTVALDNGGGVVYYGTSCAARALGMKGKRYTARNAEALISDYNDREERRAMLARTKEQAQRQADRTGEAVLVCRNKSGRGYYTVREGAYSANSYLHGCPSYTATPKGGN